MADVAARHTLPLSRRAINLRRLLARSGAGRPATTTAASLPDTSANTAPAATAALTRTQALVVSILPATLPTHASPLSPNYTNYTTATAELQLLAQLDEAAQDPDAHDSALPRDELARLRAAASERVAALRSDVDAQVAAFAANATHETDSDGPDDAGDSDWVRTPAADTAAVEAAGGGGGGHAADVAAAMEEMAALRKRPRRGVDDGSAVNDTAHDGEERVQRQLQEQYSDELVRMAAMLKSSSLLFGEMMKKDEK
ncbi:hypothetical protein HK405_008188, partial [Cladochytrium tenue]